MFIPAMLVSPVWRANFNDFAGFNHGDFVMSYECGFNQNIAALLMKLNDDLMQPGNLPSMKIRLRLLKEIHVPFLEISHDMIFHENVEARDFVAGYIGLASVMLETVASMVKAGSMDEPSVAKKILEATGKIIDMVPYGFEAKKASGDLGEIVREMERYEEFFSTED